MSRPTTKTDLITAAQEHYEKLITLMNALSERELEIAFDFSDDASKKEAHWGRDRNLRDVLIHLYEWHRLILHWVPCNQAGDSVPFLPKPYNWKTCGEMNVRFWKNHQNTSLEEAKALLEESHQQVMQLMNQFSNEELFSKGAFSWVGGSTLGSYFVSTTSSHYDWAIKKIKAHKKKVAKCS